MKIVGAIFWKNENFNFFLMWTTPNFEGRSKTKKWTKHICRGVLDIECERDCSVGLGATLGDGRKFKTIFLVSGIFPGKADSVILLGFECTINLQHLIKIVEAIFEKINFFLVWTTLNFRGRGKLKKKKARDIYKRALDIEFERDRLIGLGSTIGDGQTDTHTRIFSKTHF